MVLARNDEAATDLRDHLAEHKLNAQVITGRLSAGWRDLEHDRLVIHDFELSHRQPTRKKPKAQLGGTPLSSLSDLKIGDLVVHLKHGIALFRGMTTLEKNGFFEDYMLLEFALESKLYVPVSGIDLIQKYIGAGGKSPELSKIGGSAWKKQRAKAEKAVEDMTAELLERQAKRVAAGGITYPVDNADIRRFEASFPYEETEDQLAAIREIKGDMERPVAMDRLLCGDVGFGKTEVAMRAAYKAITGGKQVAVLAPTTLLADQHHRSFMNRFGDSGAEIACLNRFRSGKESQEILDNVRAGRVDILIGTHAILTDKLRFHDLGLLIVDEEQRFGVKHKEKLRTAGHGVDVLTMTATPIPRTLHFGMLGLRNISVIAEAPAQRLAVETRSTHWDKALIMNACQRELDRGGQIFMVHNRVKDLDEIVFKLSRLMPDMKIGSIHGQMGQKRVSQTMTMFKTGALDCLVATSIIESGIDIPNANTLFVNNAHCFGLSELHQIRGRIGRFTRQAYAYFITPPLNRLNDEAVERLSAIQEYSELGAGFKLAMRDLELRGAGNLLGSEQSGHIDAIGYELYCKLLAEAAARQGGEVSDLAKSSIQHSTLGFALDAYIPDDYLETPNLKFELHKAIDDAKRQSDLIAIAKTARDRYGNFPPPVARLFQARALRLKLAPLGIARIDLADRQVRLHLSDGLPQLDASRCEEIVHLQPDGEVLVLFVKRSLEPEATLDFLARLTNVDFKRRTKKQP